MIRKWPGMMGFVRRGGGTWSPWRALSSPNKAGKRIGRERQGGQELAARLARCRAGSSQFRPKTQSRTHVLDPAESADNSKMIRPVQLNPIQPKARPELVPSKIRK
jgi:hypothetical protein